MKIMMLETGGWGGICHYTYNLSQALSRKDGAEIALLTDTSYELDPFPRDFKLIKKPLNGSSYLKAVSEIMGVISELKPDIIHVQSIISARRDWVLFMLAHLMRMKIVLTAHNVLPHEDFEKKAFFMKRALSIIYRRADRVIAHSVYSKERLMGIFKVPPAKIAVIPHGSYLFLRTKDIPSSEAKNFLGIAADKKVILHFGAIRRYKGIDTLLSAVKELRRSRNDIVLLVAGKPVYTAVGYYREMADALGLGDSVIFNEKYVALKEIQYYFSAADLVAFPYKEVDTSGSLQAAYAFAKPVVVTRSGGASEAVDDGSNGILVAPEDPHGLSAAIEKILYDDGLRRSMGEVSFKLAQEAFSWDKIAVSTYELYKEVCSRKKNS